MKNKNPAADSIYVSPCGDDGNPGTIEKPLASLEGARDAVRSMIENGGAERDIRIFFRGGVYRTVKPVCFDLRDSARPGKRIIYEAMTGENVVFSAGIPIKGWRKAELPPYSARAAKDYIWSAPIPAGAGPCLTLYDGEQRLPRARGKGFVPVEPQQGKGEPNDFATLNFPEGALQNWPDLLETELVIRNTNPWSMNILPLASVDEQLGVARTGKPGTYALKPLKWGSDGSATAWAENSLALLDTPGTWCVNRKRKLFYYWPANGQPSQHIEVPGSTEIIRIEGKIDETGPVDRPVKGLVFRGFKFTHGERYSIHGKTGRGLQHDWEVHDQSTAMVRLRGAEGCVFENCRFIDAGGTGLRFDLHAQENIVDNCEFIRLGGCGIVLAGYGAGLKDVNRNNRISGCLIDSIGELFWHSPGVFLWQSGYNQIINNDLRNLPYAGIVVSTRGSIEVDNMGAECRRTVRDRERDYLFAGESESGRKPWNLREPLLHGRFNLIARNLIENITRIMYDGNGIYISGTGRGNIIRENWVRNFQGSNAEGIRCDDDQHDTLIESNVVSRFSGRVMGCTGIVSKGVNHIVNNIIAYPAGIMNRGMISLEMAPVTGSRIERNILFTTDPAHRPCHQTTASANSDPALLRDCRVDRNIYFNCSDSDWGERHLAEERQYGIETRSVAADPLFIDPANDDFRLHPDSPAHRLGFVPIPLHRIGRMLRSGDNEDKI